MVIYSKKTCQQFYNFCKKISQSQMRMSRDLRSSFGDIVNATNNSITSSLFNT